MAEESERISRFRREREPRLGVDLWVGKTWKFSLFSLALIEEKKNCCEGRCKCFNRAKSREDSTVQAFPLFCLKSCHFAVNGGNFSAIPFGSLCWCSYFWTFFKSFDFILCLFCCCLLASLCRYRKEWSVRVQSGCESVLVKKQMKNWKEKIRIENFYKFSEWSQSERRRPEARAHCWCWCFQPSVGIM